MRAPKQGRDIAVVLGIDPSKVLADSMRLEPFGTGWRVSWEGAAFLDGEAARILFGAPVRTNGSEPQHDASCAERCNHCEVCGVSILYGSRCPEHPNRTDGSSDGPR